VTYFAAGDLQATLSAVLGRKGIVDEGRTICVAAPEKPGLPSSNDVAISTCIGVAILSIRFFHWYLHNSIILKAHRLHSEVKCSDSVSRLTYDDAA
jgi:hypothetical protein